MKKIKLFYWRGNNFGDELSPYVVHRLSGCEIVYREAYMPFLQLVKYLIRGILHRDLSKLPYMLRPGEKQLLAIGSILQTSCKYSQVWGSGFISERNHFRGGEIFAVRGKYTDMKLRKMGHKGCDVYGDPALIMPLLYVPSVEKKHKVGIIPHHSETEYFKAIYGDKYKVIDLRTKDVEGVIDEIASCEKILATSLHGIIVSHAYKVPALWLENWMVGQDEIKFFDYFSSVGIHPYAPFRNCDEIIRGGEIDKLFSENADKTLPAVPLETIQKRLLKVAPFPLVDEFKDYIKD